MLLISFEALKGHLRVDHDLEDSELDAIVARASAVVLDYVGGTADKWKGVDGADPTIPASVEAATLLVGAALFENRDGSEDRSPQPLSRAARDLLMPFRDPSLA